MKQKKKTYTVISLFPHFVGAYTDASIIGRAQKNKLIAVKAVDLREFAEDRKHLKVDDRPYGGGPGMVLKAEPILKAVHKATVAGQKKKLKQAVILTTPRGKQFDDGEARKLAKKYDEIIFVCGRYEGVDARVNKILKPIEYSIGPYVLTGGELPALTMLDAIVRHIPGVLGDPESLEHVRLAPKDTFTRPQSFVWKKKTYTVPAVLVSGNHAHVEQWRAKGTKKKKASVKGLSTDSAV